MKSKSKLLSVALFGAIMFLGMSMVTAPETLSTSMAETCGEAFDRCDGNYPENYKKFNVCVHESGACDDEGVTVVMD